MDKGTDQANASLPAFHGSGHESLHRREVTMEEKKERPCETAEPSKEFNFDRFCQLLDKAFEEWCEELQKQLEQPQDNTE